MDNKISEIKGNSTNVDEMSFENIFNKQKEVEADTTVVKTILQQKNEPPKVKPILGYAPTLQKSIEESKIIDQKRNLRLAQTVFLLVVFTFLGMAAYFYSELSPKFDLFGPNTTARITDINQNLKSSQTTINKYKFLAAQLDLSAFSLVADEYLDKTAQMAGNSANASVLLPKVDELADELASIFERIKENLSPDIAMKTYRTRAEQKITDQELKAEYDMALRAAFQDDRKKIVAAKIVSDSNEQNLRLIDNALKLVGNDKLLRTINAVSVDSFRANLKEYAQTLDGEKRKEIQTTMESILASTKSDIATIGAVKAGRTEWSWIIDRIEQVTAVVDPNFNSGLFEITGKEIVYTGYEFEASSNKIVLSGTTKTNDANNFTVISDLIDQLEESPFFQNVDMRSFTKSGSIEQGYTANFKIDLRLELDGYSAKNAPISLAKRNIAVKPVKRIATN
jgi:hypothetical protein